MVPRRATATGEAWKGFEASQIALSAENLKLSPPNEGSIT
jgi:hypothetical protein